MAFVAVYLLTMAVGQPICGRLVYVHGRRRMYLIGLGWFALASIACGIAPSLPWLLLFRAQQALAGALCIPNGIAPAAEAVPAERRGQSFGVIGMAAGTAAAIGPPLGGFLVQFRGWPAIFLANVPVIAVAVALALRSLPDSGPGAQGPGRFDYQGSLLLGLALCVIVLVPVTSERFGALGIGTLVPLAGLAGVMLVEARVLGGLARGGPDAVPPSALRVGMRIGQPQQLHAVHHVAGPAAVAREGVLGAQRGTPAPGAGLGFRYRGFLGPLGGRWADRRGYWWPAVLGAVGLAAGSILLAASVAGAGIGAIVVSLAIMGVGLGIASVSVQTAAVESVPHDQTASASGIFSMFRYIGSVVGSTILALSITGETGQAGERSFTLLFTGMTVVSLLGIVANSRVADLHALP